MTPQSSMTGQRKKTKRMPETQSWVNSAIAYKGFVFLGALLTPSTISTTKSTLFCVAFQSVRVSYPPRTSSLLPSSLTLQMGFSSHPSFIDEDPLSSAGKCNGSDKALKTVSYQELLLLKQQQLKGAQSMQRPTVVAPAEDIPSTTMFDPPDAAASHVQVSEIVEEPEQENISSPTTLLSQVEATTNPQEIETETDTPVSSSRVVDEAKEELLESLKRYKVAEDSATIEEETSDEMIESTATTSDETQNQEHIESLTTSSTSTESTSPNPAPPVSVSNDILPQPKRLVRYTGIHNTEQQPKRLVRYNGASVPGTPVSSPLSGATRPSTPAPPPQEAPPTATTTTVTTTTPTSKVAASLSDSPATDTLEAPKQQQQQQPVSQPAQSSPQPQQQKKKSYFAIAAEFDRISVSSWLNNPDFKRRLNDSTRYFELFDHPEAEWSSSEFIRKEHHRRKKDRKRIGHSLQTGHAREVGGDESLFL